LSVVACSEKCLLIFYDLFKSGWENGMFASPCVRRPSRHLAHPAPAIQASPCSRSSFIRGVTRLIGQPSRAAISAFVASGKNLRESSTCFCFAPRFFEAISCAHRLVSWIMEQLRSVSC
jgi:hypothetical protein